MKLNWKNIKNHMDMYNPYNDKNEYANEKNYNDLWAAIRTLCVFNYDEGNKIFLKMVEYDRKLYTLEY